MPLKVTLTLPSGAVLSLEVSERDAFDEIARAVLDKLPQALAAGATANGHSNGNGAPSAAHAATPASTDASPSPGPQADTLPPPAASRSSTKAVEGSAAPSSVGPSIHRVASSDFARFCREQDPMGDMRRLVVAAEGARRHLSMNNVSARELGELFDAAGWPRPQNFVQTLRNASRSTFRWLERVPGREGYYSVSDRGRAAVIKQGTSP